MLVDNAFDPATPLRSAFNTSASFEGSVLLENGGGYASICTAKAIRNYFVNGVSPEVGTVCESSAPPFSGIVWTDLIRNWGTRQ
ncbi:hypothetical protein F5Y15DRAFT_415730 [Xylariaceae sp. FL0016]|nr:hypothetical protein F5Y15DRAFT_415730 [Xylariaceae sp. FL0016]